MTILQLCDMFITKELIEMAESIMLEKAKDFAVNIVNLCRNFVCCYYWLIDFKTD